MLVMLRDVSIVVCIRCLQKNCHLQDSYFFTSGSMRCFQLEALHSLGICPVRLPIWPPPGLASCAARRLPQVWYDKAEELGACPWEGFGSSKGGRGSEVLQK